MGYWQNGVTPMNEDNMNKIIMYRGGVPSNITDFNNLTDTGIYYIGDKTLSNAPNNYKYHYVEVINNGAMIVQKIYVANSNEINIRDYMGSPASWGSWKNFIADTIELSTLTDTDEYFSTIDVNRVLKCGKLVQINFRGLLQKNIPDNVSFLKAPYAAKLGANYTDVLYVGTHYSASELKWFYLSGGQYFTGPSGLNEKWIHINTTYLID